MKHIFPVILLVDDEEEILEFLSYNLEREGYKVFTAKNGAEGISKAVKIIPDIIVLDVMMPVIDGIETCKKLRSMSQFRNTLITMLTAYGNDQLQCASFNAGADDFIAKPIRPRLFLCHINALLKRKQKLNSGKKLLNFKDIIIDSEAYTVFETRNKKKIDLSKKELELLLFLVSKPGKVFNRKEIMVHVWGNEDLAENRTIDVHVKKLRDKIGFLQIKTVKGIGFVFQG